MNMWITIGQSMIIIGLVLMNFGFLKELDKKLEVEKGKVITTLTSNWNGKNGEKETIYYLILKDKNDTSKLTINVPLQEFEIIKN